MATRTYDSTIARIAGNIAAGLVKNYREMNDEKLIAEESVSLARAIVAEIERTEPAKISENVNKNGTLPQAGHPSERQG